MLKLSSFGEFVKKYNIFLIYLRALKIKSQFNIAFKEI